MFCWDFVACFRSSRYQAPALLHLHREVRLSAHFSAQCSIFLLLYLPALQRLVFLTTGGVVPMLGAASPDVSYLGMIVFFFLFNFTSRLHCAPDGGRGAAARGNGDGDGWKWRTATQSDSLPRSRGLPAYHYSSAHRENFATIISPLENDGSSPRVVMY
ncbi:hypothetical protein C8R45DRAFT_117126 [Mycena sanguinolenta]|nr:hypothetical protein C8R45DRAFT_117126 [Mycena sanguinolenta]